MKINGQIFTDKGNIKPEARKQLLASIASNPAILGTAEHVKDNTYTIPVDCGERTVYVNVDLTISTIHPADRKPATKKSKAKVEDAEPVVIEG